jgi:hypothetical protein
VHSSTSLSVQGRERSRESVKTQLTNKVLISDFRHTLTVEICVRLKDQGEMTLLVIWDMEIRASVGAFTWLGRPRLRRETTL